jgi:hypothetical protein
MTELPLPALPGRELHGYMGSEAEVVTYISNPGNIATSAILLFGNDLNVKLDQEWQIQGGDFQDWEFEVCSVHFLRIQGFFQTLLHHLHGEQHMNTVSSHLLHGE